MDVVARGSSREDHPGLADMAERPSPVLVAPAAHVKVGFSNGRALLPPLRRGRVVLDSSL